MDYTNVRALKLYEQIAQSIERSIIEEKIVPGERLDSVEQLAKNFNVSRSAIREALTALKAKGLLEIRQGEGTFVRKLTVDDITLHVPNAAYSTEELQQIFEVRKILELGIVELAATSRKEQHLQTLQLAIEQMDAAQQDPQQSSAADLLFHTTLAQAANNPLLVTMIENISKPIATQIEHTRTIVQANNQHQLQTLHNEHQKIYSALLQRNAALATEAMREHLQTIEQILFK